MKAIYVALAALGLAFAGSAFALGDCNGNGACSSDDHSITATAGAQAGANAGAAANVYAPTDVDVRNTLTQGQHQGQGQEQSQRQGQEQGQGQVQGNIGLGSGNVTKIKIDAPVIPSETRNHTTPDVFVGAVHPTASCALGFSLGGSVTGGGGGLGFSWESHKCRVQELAKQWYSMTGHADDAVALLCTIEENAVVPACKKPAAPAKAAAMPAPAPVAVAATRPTCSPFSQAPCEE